MYAHPVQVDYLGYAGYAGYAPVGIWVSGYAAARGVLRKGVYCSVNNASIYTAT